MTDDLQASLVLAISKLYNRFYDDPENLQRPHNRSPVVCYLLFTEVSSWKVKTETKMTIHKLYMYEDPDNRVVQDYPDFTSGQSRTGE